MLCGSIALFRNRRQRPIRGHLHPHLDASSMRSRATSSSCHIGAVRRPCRICQEIPPAEQQSARWLADFQQTEIDKWVPLVKAAKVKLD
jgi:hypothetical protein